MLKRVSMTLIMNYGWGRGFITESTDASFFGMTREEGLRAEEWLNTKRSILEKHAVNTARIRLYTG
jgi:hypothetical protein